MSHLYDNQRVRNIYYLAPPSVKSLFASIYFYYQKPTQFGGAYKAQLDELEQDSTLPIDILTSKQINRLKQLLIHSNVHIPYYRRLFAEIKFDPESIKSIDDLLKIPLLDKETVANHNNEFVTKINVGPVLHARTSGTTGKSLNLTISHEAHQRHYACQWYHYGWAGIKRGDRICTFAGHPVSSTLQSKPPFWVHNWINNEMLFSSHHMTPVNLPSISEALANFNPHLIRGYPSSVYLLALYQLESGKKNIHPKAVFTSSETLLGFQKEAIEQAFNCQSYSYYSNTELAAHILQCSQKKFHIISDLCVVEVVDFNGNPVRSGEEGELVCTGLINLAMPLIRFRIGDTGIKADGTCTCGVNSPILSNITGRVDDYVITPDGRHVGRLDHAFKSASKVKEAQILQDDLSEIIVNIVPRQGFNSTDEKEILDELHLRLGTELQIRLNSVDQIPRTASGKFRFVISKIPIQIVKEF